MNRTTVAQKIAQVEVCGFSWDNNSLKATHVLVTQKKYVEIVHNQVDKMTLDRRKCKNARHGVQTQNALALK